MFPLFSRLFPAILVLVLTAPVSVSLLAVEEPPAGEVDKAQLQREEALLARIWWNQAAKIQALELSAAQREAMDEKFRPFIRSYNARHAAIQTERQAFSQALYEADMSAAEELRDNVVKYQSEFVEQQVQVMMDVAQLLSEEQLAVVGEQFPALFSRNWIRPFKPGAKGGRQGPGH